MKRELDEKLCKIAPCLFRDRHADMRTTALCWGFDVGDGWYAILKEAAEKLEPLCKAELDKYMLIEKNWYKYVRRVVGFTVKVPFIFHILYNLIGWLQPDIYGSPMHWYGGGPRAVQIKEKYGTLRFYLTHGTDEMYAIVYKAESQSKKTCETCGKPGKSRGRGWYYTLCLSCWKKKAK